MPVALGAWLRNRSARVTDVLVTLVVGIATVGSAFIVRGVEHPTFVGVLFGLAATLPLLVRRRWPFAVLAVVFAAGVLAPVDLPFGLPLAVALYTIGANRSRQATIAACGAVVASALAYALAGGSRFGVADAIGIAVVSAIAAAIGLYIGGKRTRITSLEREREENARRAVFEERVRIARELHDVVAHHVSMMGVQAGAARVVIDRDRGKAKDALAAIETSSRQAVLELHRLLGFLRQAGDREDLGPQPGLGELPRLAASMSDSELTVAVSVEGEQRPLAPTVDVSAYRIVQEALTNTLKHAGASRADVRLHYGPDELEIEIVDDGRANGSSSAAPGGLGLIGMRERAALHGGQLTAGPAVGGGFAVRVRLPTPAGAL